MIESLASRAPVFSSITDARTQETTQLQIGDWVEDSLILFDLGYLGYARLARIDRNGGWFVSRLNIDANPEIIDELRTWCGDTIDLEGTHLQEVLPDLYRQIIDTTGTVGADRHDPHLPYDVRVVGIRHEDDESTHRTAEVMLITTTTSTRRICQQTRSRRENSRRCTAVDGASKRS